MTTHLDNEAVLVSEAQTGNAGSFAVLVKQYERQIYRLSRVVTGHPEDAEDALQETFLKAFKNLKQFRGGITILHLAGSHRHERGINQAAPAKYFSVGFIGRAYRCGGVRNGAARNQGLAGQPRGILQPDRATGNSLPGTPGS